MKVYFLINVGRRKDPPPRYVLEGMKKAFQQRGIDCHMELTRSVEECRECLERAARSPYDSLWVGGGDGTLNHVLNNTIGRFASYAVVPMGTINGVARALGVPKDPVEAVNWLLDGEPTSLDLGRVGDRYFMLYATIGYHAAVFHATNDELKRRFGRTAFFAAGALQALKAHTLPKFQVDIKNVGSIDDACVLPQSSSKITPDGKETWDGAENNAMAWDQQEALDVANDNLALGGELAEPVLATEELPSPRDVELIRRTGYSLVLSNFCNFAGFGAIREGELCNSSFLQTHLFESNSLWPMLRFFSAMRYRRPSLDDPGVEHFRAAELTVQSEHPLQLQVDGEPIHIGTDMKFRFHCIPKAVEVIWNREAVISAAANQSPRTPLG